ncbi:MAG: hypothetical protein ABW212_06505 [Pseudonocardia sediminis]
MAGTAARLGGFAIAIAVVFAGGSALGGAVGPTPTRTVADVGGSGGGAIGGTDPNHAGDHSSGGGPALDATAPGSAPAAPADPEAATMGLSSTRAGYSLVPTVTSLPWQEPTEVAFTITGSDGAPVQQFVGAPGEQMDAAVVRRDDAGYTRLRATLGPDGVWRAPVTFPGAGVWRLYAGFDPIGGPAQMDLGTDLFVSGPFGPFSFTGEQRSAQVGDYQVRLDGGLLAGGESRVFATVSRDGVPVTDLEPAQGSFGSMVAVRQGDLARFPLRPEVTGAAPDARSGPGVAFVADIPSTGSYRLFLTFTHDGTEHACEFTVGTPAGS